MLLGLLMSDIRSGMQVATGPNRYSERNRLNE